MLTTFFTKALPQGGIMTQQNERPRPHGDPLQKEIVEPNQAQRQSDAPGDAVSGEGPEEVTEEHDRMGGRGSTANGIPAADEGAGRMRRRQYEQGAEIVTKLD
jgi:hypothetical protein